MKNNIEFVNVLEDCFTLWEYCKENNFTDSDYEDFYQAGGDLQFFEGDPDIIKVHGETGFFALCGDVCFYWFDDWKHEAETILKAFFNSFETGITLGGEHYRIGTAPAGVVESSEIQNWDAWEKIKTGIAWRGGAGYHYHIQAWGNFLARA